MTQVPDQALALSVDIDARRAQAVAALGFDDFYRCHAAAITQALDLTLRDSELASDATNEAMTRALMRWKQVGGYANPAGWVYRVGLNWARSWVRRRRRERERPLPAAATIDDAAAFEPGLARALDRLPVEQRAVVVCRYFLDWSTAETATALAVAPGTVKSRLSRALNQIRADLGVTEEDQ